MRVATNMLVARRPERSQLSHEVTHLLGEDFDGAQAMMDDLILGK